ncbi:hypothetical protein SDC9_134917 [bioreactor metagenome]|uniref:Uncharacterized protein n=1 Tax=bioreactor metagenome TaxID=1076179 RepID=A0A645DEX6_9ZZZZ
MLIFAGFFDSCVLQKTNGSLQTQNTGHIGGPGFELIGQIIEGCSFETYVFNHFSATLPWGHHFKPFFPAIQDAGSHGCIHFMTRKGQKIASERLNVNFQMGNRLCCINQNRNSGSMGKVNHFLYRVDNAKHIADMGNADEFRVFICQ